MTTASSIDAIAIAVELETEVRHRWVRLRDRVEREAVARHPTLGKAFTLLHRVNYPQKDARRNATRIDPVIAVHAATLAHVWQRVVRNPRLGGVYRARLEQVREAQRAGNMELARALFDQITRGQALKDLEQRPALLLLRATIRFQCQMQAAAAEDLDALLRVARTTLGAQPRLASFVQHLLGVCFLKAGDARRAVNLLAGAVRTAVKERDDQVAAYALIDLALAQADYGAGSGGSVQETLAQLAMQLPPLFDRLPPEAGARLRRHLCKFAGSPNFHLVQALGHLAFDKLSFTPEGDEAPSGMYLEATRSAIEAFNGIFAMLDQQADFSGVSDEFFSVVASRDLGLGEHPLARVQRSSLLDDNFAPFVAGVAAQAATTPQMAEAALQGGVSFCMAMRMGGQPDVALYANVCLEHLSRMRGPTSELRVAIAIQRGYLLLNSRRLDDAETCFDFALQLMRRTRQSFSVDASLALLGLGRCDYLAGRHADSRTTIWTAYAIACIAPRGDAQRWRSAFALSTTLNVDAEDDQAGLRREAALLLDKMAIQKMLDGFARNPEAQLPGSAEWFPSMRQALSSLVALGRIVEAESVREVVRAASIDELTSAHPVQRAQLNPSVLSEGERQAWEQTMGEVERDFDELRELLGSQAMGTGLAPAAVRQRQRRIIELWTGLPERLEQALLEAAQRLTAPAESSAGALQRRPARAAVPLREGEALIGYLVQPDQLFISLDLPGATHAVVVNVPISATALLNAVMALRSVCADAAKPMDLVHEEGRRVYRLLIEPVREALEEARITSVGIAPHEFIDLVPFAALWDGTRFMAECFAWSLRRPTSADAETQPVANFEALEMALFGATEFQEDQIALPGVALELHRISRDVGPRARTWMGRDLDAQALLERLGDPAVGIVHIATHAFFDPRDDSKSYLDLGHGARLGLPEIREKLRRPLPLLVLAACSTGARGPVRDSIASSFMRCGARHVLATQWHIHDASSSWIMPLFYRQLNWNGQTPAQALQAAQRNFIDGSAAYARWDDAQFAPVRLSPAEFRHPRWWAPFTLFQ